jgi:hypothetical protein
MKLGAEPKKVGALVALFAVAGIVYWMNSSDSPSPSPTPAASRSATDSGAVVTSPPVNPNSVKQRRAVSGTATISDSGFKRPDSVDPMKTDATLRLDLLAKVQNIGAEGGVRNIFVREQAPAEPVKPDTNGKIPLVAKIDPKKPTPTPVAVVPPPPQPAGPAGPPPAPPINLKYYGYSTKRSDGEKKAFFLDGEDIIVASEGEIIKKQYKVVKIGVNSVQMEDTTSKSTQSLPIQQDAAPATA